jgi:hypothetical protein
MMNTSILKRTFCVERFSFIVLMMSVLVLMVNGCSGGLKLSSDWQQPEMVIDGNDAQWQRGLYYDKETDMVYGVRNDEKYIYIFLKTVNRSTQMQIGRQGLTVWFDREDGKNQTFGIHYPMSRQESRTGFIPDTNEENPHSFLDQEYPELEIIGPNNQERQRFSALEAPGVRVKLGRTRETIMYELRVPLNKTSDQPFAVEPTSSNRIGIEFETGEFKPGQLKGGMRPAGGHELGEESGEGNPEERGEIDGGRRSHAGGNQGGRFGAMEKTKRMELWLSVQLARPVSP